MSARRHLWDSGTPAAIEGLPFCDRAREDQCL